jgi:hypothetical protein
MPINEYRVTRLTGFTAGKPNSEVPASERLGWYIRGENEAEAIAKMDKRFAGQEWEAKLYRENVPAIQFREERADSPRAGASLEVVAAEVGA